MIQEIVNQLATEINKEKDKWFLETMEKHNLIKSSDVSNFDLYWLSAEMGVKVVSGSGKTQIYIYDRLVGEWYEDVLLTKEGSSYVLKVDKWN